MALIPEEGRRTRRKASSRDQAETAFTGLLSALLSRIPAALGAALVDRDGETVDYAGSLAPFEVRVASAHWRIVVDEASARPPLEGLSWLSVRAAHRSYVARVLPHGYALVLVLESAGATEGWQRAVAACAFELADEAGWTWAGMAKPEWSFVRAASDDRGRPLSVQVGDRGHAVEVLGAVKASSVLARFERGWRVRFDTGIEATLVREPGGAWYTDEPIDPADYLDPSKNTLTGGRR